MSDKRFSTSGMYDVYNVSIQFRDKLCGGKPMNQELLSDHIKRTTGHDDIITKKQIEDAVECLPDTSALLDLEEEKLEKSRSGFLSDDNGLYIETFQIKAMYRQSGSMLGMYVKKKGSRQICAEGSEIKGADHESRVYLWKEKPDGTDESVIHVKGPKGPISGIKHVDYVSKARISFQIWVLKTQSAESRHIGENDVIRILTFAQENGLGADRSRGFGKFDVVEFSSQ